MYGTLSALDMYIFVSLRRSQLEFIMSFIVHAYSLVSLHASHILNDLLKPQTIS